MGGGLRRSLLGYGYPLKYAQRIILPLQESVTWCLSRLFRDGFGLAVNYRSAEQFPIARGIRRV